MLEQVRNEAKAAALEICQVAKLRKGQILVVGCSTSEVTGHKVGSYSSPELGQAIYNIPLANHILDKFNYDFVLGSIHNLPEMEDFFFMDYKDKDVYDLLSRYFQKELELAKWDGFDSLAHLTYPLRYMVGEQKIPVDMTRFDDVIGEIFETLIKNHKALEINTSGIAMPLGDTLPGEAYIQRFHDMGGQYITVGSDAHVPEKLCGNVDKGMALAKKCGFDYVTIFNRREPMLVPIA